MRRIALAVAAVVLVACSGSTDDATPAPPSTAPPTTPAPAPATSLVAVAPATTVAPPPSTPAAPTTTAATTLPPTTVPPTTVPPTTEVPRTSSAPGPPALGSGTTPYGLPVADADAAGWGDTHSEYPASDVFVDCGAVIVSPVNGVIAEARRVNAYDPAVDNPATRGGRSVAVIGDDGVRYYMAHFESIDEGIEPGVRVAIGQPLGLMGQTGRASACHVHFSISPPCPGQEWSVRRGVVWPYPYLDDWRDGGQRSPVDEVRQWLLDHPDACAAAMADPNAGDA